MGSGGLGEGGVPPHHRSLHWLGQHQIRPSRGANEWRRRCKRRRRLFKNGRTERSAHNQTAAPICTEMENKVTNFSGKWKMKSSENFEELLKALGELLVIKFCYCDALLCNLDKLSKPACSQLLNYQVASFVQVFNAADYSLIIF